MGEVEVTSLDAPSMGRVLDRLGTAVGNFGSAVDRISTTVAQTDGCWGTDQFGQSFAQNYVPSAGQVLDHSTSAVPDLRTNVENLQHITTMFAQQDGDGPLVLNTD